MVKKQELKYCYNCDYYVIEEEEGSKSSFGTCKLNHELDPDFCPDSDDE